MSEQPAPARIAEPRAHLAECETATLNATTEPVNLAIRAECAELDHPPAVWNSSLERTFCHCGAHRYLRRIDHTAAIHERNRWEPIRLRVCAAARTVSPEDQPAPARRRRSAPVQASRRDAVETVRTGGGVL